MKTRGIYFLIVSIPSLPWVLLDPWQTHEVPFGYDYDSAGWSVPLYIRILGNVGVFGTLAGFFVLAYDFANRKNRTIK